MKFSKLVKTATFNILALEWERILNLDSDRAMGLLGGLWNLEGMQSEDSRFKNGYRDIYQHIINNNDWSTEQLFIDRLALYDDEEVFKKFIETLLDPQYYNVDGHLEEISDKLDEELGKDKLRLVIEDYTDTGLPIQKVYPIEDFNSLPPGIKKNNIPFYVLKNDKIKPEESQYFTLDPNTGWNDYSIKSGFTLEFHDESTVSTNIGYVKIIYNEEMVTWDHIPDKFYILSENYCSLGQTEDYYFNLKDKFTMNGLISILHALQDAAYFPDIHDNFEKNRRFNASLIRYDEQERLIRVIRPKLQGYDDDHLFSFSYQFKPIYSDDPVKINFDFNSKVPLPNRIFAVIGKNGTGKTQLMTTLPLDFSRTNADIFDGKIPLFSKVITVSYSVFDNFTIPKKNASFNYVYCGLKNETGEIRSNKSLTSSFHINWKRIKKLERLAKWRSVLLNFIDIEIVSAFIIPDDSNWLDGNYEVNLEGFNSIKNKLSSGQSIILYIITEIVANIRFDSLLIYDEPETHLHPNAIVQLMNTIYELVNEFQSYCLIATHSPIVIRELFSKNVYVMERTGNVPAFRRIGLECFGENLSVLTDEVFGDREVPKQYKKIIIELVDKGNNFEQIVDLLEFDEFPLSLNACIFIRNIIKERNDKL